MNRISNRSVGRFCVALMLFALTSANSQDISDRDQGMSAYWALDYDTAIELLTPLAEAGDAEAAYYLGMMYDPLTQLIDGFNAKYQADYHDVDKAWAWYKRAMDGNYDPAYMRGSYLATTGPLDKDSIFRERALIDAGTETPQRSGRVQTSAHASRLSAGSGMMNAYQRKVYRIWRKDPINLEPDEKYLYLKAVSENERRSTYISRFEKIEPTLEACGKANNNLCYYYLGIIQLDAARTDYSGFNDKYLDAWVSFSLAERMGNQHAAVYRYVIGEVLNEKEKQQVQTLLASKNQ